MATILQLQAQYESLAAQYRSNQAEMSACIARRDEGIVFTVYSTYAHIAPFVIVFQMRA